MALAPETGGLPTGISDDEGGKQPHGGEGAITTRSEQRQPAKFKVTKELHNEDAKET